MQIVARSLLLLLLSASSLSASFAQQTSDSAQEMSGLKSAIRRVNLALNKPFVSSDPNQWGWGAGLTDGSWRANKGTTFATGNSATFPKTATIDLEAPTPVEYVAVGVPGYGSTKTVTVSLSGDGTTFFDVGNYVFSTGKEEKHIFSFPSTVARYVRLTYNDHYDQIFGFPNVYCFTTEVAVYAPGKLPYLPPVIPAQIADVASPRYGGDDEILPRFLAMHRSFLKRGKQGPIGLLFLGDSITEGWGLAQDVWNQRYGAYQPANFGIAGDGTQNVLWRIEKGELNGINPKVVVLMIGTNNMSARVDEIIRGERKVVEQIHQKLPNTKLLLLGIFPRNAKASDPLRAKIKAVNAELAKLDNGNKTRYLDIGDKFLAPNGSLSRKIMPDYLHPNAKGYQIWADAMQPLLDEMMK